MKVISKFTEVEGMKIHYLEAGQGEPILFIHGWPTSSYLWRNILQELSTSYRAIAFDLPGFGQSDKRLADSFSFRYHGRILNGLLTNLNIDTFTLGVHDLGGPIGLYWLVNNMDKVKRLLLFNTLIYSDFSWAVKLFGLSTRLPGIRNWLTSRMGLEKAMRFGVFQKDKLTPEIIAKYQEPFSDMNARKVLLKTAQRLSMKGFKEIEAKLENFQGPVQIIYGKQDKILPEVAKTMQRVIRDLPQAKIAALDNCGHFLQEDAPEEISKTILTFINDNP